MNNFRKLFFEPILSAIKFCPAQQPLLTSINSFSQKLRRARCPVLWLVGALCGKAYAQLLAGYAHIELGDCICGWVCWICIQSFDMVLWPRGQGDRDTKDVFYHVLRSGLTFHHSTLLDDIAADPPWAMVLGMSICQLPMTAICGIVIRTQ